MGLTTSGDRTGVKVEKLLTWLEGLKAELDIPASIREAGVNEAAFLAKVDQLAVEAFDDQCTGANPRFPLISELKQLLLDSYYGRASPEAVTVGEEVKEAKSKKTKAKRKIISDAVIPVEIGITKVKSFIKKAFILKAFSFMHVVSFCELFFAIPLLL